MTSLNQRGRYGRYGRFIANLLTLGDFVVVNIVCIVVVWLNPESFHKFSRLLWLLANVAYVPAALALNEVRKARAIHMDRIMLNAIRAVGLHALFFFSLLFFLDVEGITWDTFTEFYVGIVIMLPLWWVGSRLALKYFRRRGRNYIRVAIIGTGATGVRLYEEMKSDSGFGYKVIGFMDYSCSSDFPYADLYAGDLSDLGDWVREQHIDQIFYTLSGEDENAIHRCLTIADDNMAQFYFVPQLSRFLKRAFQMHSIGAVPVMTVRNNPLTSMVNRGIKRTVDIIVSATVLLLSPVLFLPVAVAIKMSSPGPVFFRQRRTGYRGKEFTCLKFRTMRVNEQSDSLQATKDDPRKTRVGDFLRRTSIDELPQFINVFRGEMSVVGPRPHMLAHTAQYSKLIDKYMVRHLIKPGITGWAQVNGYRGKTGQLWQMERRVEYDTWYIENWSLMLDLKIMLRTVFNAFHGEENAF